MRYLIFQIISTDNYNKWWINRVDTIQCAIRVTDTIRPYCEVNFEPEPSQILWLAQ